MLIPDPLRKITMKTKNIHSHKDTCKTLSLF
jgi:hypothetical protein